MLRGSTTIGRICALALGLGLSAWVPAQAHGARARATVFPAMIRTRHVPAFALDTSSPLARILPRIAARYRGRMLDADLHELVPGEPVYRVLWLTPDGRRLEIWVDARSGQILRVEG